MAAFLSIIIGAFISNFLSAHVGILAAASERVGGMMTGLTGAVVPEEAAGLLAISTFLAFLWGVAYHYARQRSAAGPKDYTTDNKQSGGYPPMSQHASPGVSEEGKVDGSAYRTVGAAWRADEVLRAELRRTLDEAKSRLDDVHDRCVDTERRERADRATTIIDSITQAERTISRMASGSAPSGQPADRVDENLRGRLVATHGRLTQAGENLLESVRAAHEESPDVAEARFEECEERLQALERALTERRNHVQKLGETK
jgi:hypothetical protein